MTKRELLKALIDLQKDTDADREPAHVAADELLLAYINDARITEAYERIQKYYA